MVDEMREEVIDLTPEGVMDFEGVLTPITRPEGLRLETLLVESTLRTQTPIRLGIHKDLDIFGAHKAKVGYFIGDDGNTYRAMTSSTGEPFVPNKDLSREVAPYKPL